MMDGLLDNDWCVSRNMSWTAVAAICDEHNISFVELPVAAPGFYAELARVSRKGMIC